MKETKENENNVMISKREFLQFKNVIEQNYKLKEENMFFRQQLKEIHKYCQDTLGHIG
ncbi:hypothetical protein [Clostridium estertheticum]|uniref:hypothetical protein n=1 Tax=Clostridium estertheticum TaxID=238834 RepID=UPI000AC79B2E|nr:hypothetical protein [Clostridium estertheticum]